MKKFFFIIPFVCLLYGCHPDNCVCSTYEACIGNRCQCGEWAEGDTCTPMRNKFIGTWIGYLYLNGANPKADTITFAVTSLKPLNFLFATNGNFGIYMRFSTQVNYFTNYTTSNSDTQIDCGVGLLSADHKTLTLTYLPVISPGIIDSTNQYTFIGAKQ